MKHCEMNNKSGLIIILNFAKAFDTIEWTFINEGSKFLNS